VNRFSHVMLKVWMELRRFVIRRLLPTEMAKRIARKNATPNFLLYPTPEQSFRSDDFDLVIATDLRFIGGSGQSTLEEVLVAQSQGWKVGLYHIPSKLVDHRGIFDEGISTALNSGKATLVNNVAGRIRTQVLLFRHPSVLNYGGAPLPDIEAKHVLLVVNHTPIKLGRIDYLLPYCARQLRLKYNVTPKVFPIGPLVRDAVNELYDGTVQMEERDWTNIFDLDRFAVGRVSIDRSVIRIGRHSRPGREKWLTNAEDIRAAYPLRPDIEVHVLGGADVPDRILRGRPRNWTVHRFGAMPPEKFLSEIDVFVYYHHPDWVEAFGRAIVEAMASGLPVILPQHFQRLFLDSAIYCTPGEVAKKVEQLKKADTYRIYSEKAVRFARENFSHAALISRLENLGLQKSDRSAPKSPQSWPQKEAVGVDDLMG
jgi:glycosyltransferase involved in cell wall biosynthesis